MPLPTTLLALFATVVALDVASNGVLFWSSFADGGGGGGGGGGGAYASPAACLSDFGRCFRQWRAYALDTSTLVVVRLLLSAVGSALAVRLGRAPAAATPPTATPPTAVCPPARGESLQAPLLSGIVVVHDDASSKCAAATSPLSRDGTPLIRGVLGPDGRKNASKVAKQKAIIDRKAHAELRKNLCLAAVFAVNTVVSMYIGIKVVVFDFSTTRIALQAAMLGTAPVWINVEFVLVRYLVDEFTKARGQMFKGVHHHPLFLKPMPCNWCDMCREQIRERTGYRCDLCDFDVCNACAAKKDRSRAEGVVRGDGGVKEEKEVTSCAYFCRAMRLAVPHSGTIAIAMCALLVNSGARIWLPNYTGEILDAVVHSDRNKFWSDVTFYAILSVITGAFGALRNLCVSLVGQRIAKDVREQLFGAILVQDIAFFDGMPTGQLTSRLTNDTNAMVSPLNTILNTLVSSGLLLIGGLVMCLWTSWRLSLLAFTSIGPIIYITSVYARWSRGLGTQIWAALGDANAIATEAISNVRTVRAFGRELGEIIRFNESIGMALAKATRDAIAGAGTYAITNYIDLGAGVLILGYGGTVAIAHPDRLSVGKLITFQLYWGMISSAYQSLTGVVSSLTRAGGAATRVITLLENLPDIDPTEGLELDPEAMRGELVLNEVEFFYQMRPDNKVLRKLSLTIQSGTVVALVGRSGSGKTTVINLMQRFYNPTGGSIMLDGVNVRDIQPLSLRRAIASVHQDTQLFNRTIEENIAYGVEDYTKEEVVSAAKEANAFDFIMEQEEGFQTKVGERGTRLSGGQKQRIALARVFLRKPKILLLDEATSALDTESEALVQSAIDRLIQRGGCTVVLVAHRLSTVVNADKIGVVHKGRIVECGTHHELLENEDGIYHRLVAHQLAKEANVVGEGGGGAEGGGEDLVDDLIDAIAQEARGEGKE
jgi:ABC-type multidrug transport system fused ATPase/permease subunit